MKGLEFGRVIVAGANDGTIPLKWPMQSEDATVRDAAGVVDQCAKRDPGAPGLLETPPVLAHALPLPRGAPARFLAGRRRGAVRIFDRHAAHRRGRAISRRCLGFHGRA